MNDRSISLNELLDLYWGKKISKGTLVRTFENIFFNKEYVLLYCDVDYCCILERKQIKNLKEDKKAPIRSVKKTEQFVLSKIMIDCMFLTTKIILSENRKPRIDTEIFDFSSKHEKFWFSQIKNFENLLQESMKFETRLIDGTFLDLKEIEDSKLVTPENNKLLKRFIKLEID